MRYGIVMRYDINGVITDFLLNKVVKQQNNCLEIVFGADEERNRSRC